jgi:signal transduction histidine kinase/sensor domain CHASE-containing protein
MSLRKITFLFIVLLTVGFIGVVLFNVTRILSNHFISQEKFNMVLSIHQVENAFQQQYSFLEKTSKDWGNWDRTYQFMESRDPQYIEENLQPGTYQDLDIDLIVMVGNNQQILYSGYVKNNQFTQAPPPGLLEHLTAGDRILAQPDQVNSKEGLLEIADLPMMLVSHPILRTDGSGPSRGTLVIGKYIDKSFLDNINSLLLLSADLFPITKSQSDPVYSEIQAYQPTEKNPFFIDLNETQISGYAVLKDFYQQPGFFLRVTSYPALYNNGLLVNNYLMILLVIISVILGLTIFVLIEFNVLNRVRQLGRAVQAIGSSGSIDSRLQVGRRDELAVLALNINEMLEALQRAILQKKESEDRFRTLVESMEDMVFTVERGDPQRPAARVKVYPKNNSTGTSLPVGNDLEKIELLQAELENQLMGQPQAVDRAFLGDSATLEWDTTSQGQAHTLFTTLSPIYNAQEDIVGVVGVSKDVTGQKHLEQDLRDRIYELRALLNTSQQFMTQVENDTIPEDICRLAVEHLRLQTAAIFSVSLEGSLLTLTASCGQQNWPIQKIPLYPIAGQALHPIAAVFNDSGMKLFPNSLIEVESPGQSPEGNKSAVIPLTYGENALAVLVLIKDNESNISEKDLPLITAFTNLCSVALQNAYLFKQVSTGRAQLQEMSKRLVEVQEEERRHIALELHDEIGQILTGLRFSINTVSSLAPEKINDQISQTTVMIDEMIRRIRQLSLDLRPSILDDLGVIPTIIWYLDHYTAQTGVQIHFQHTNILGQRFSPNVEITIFRIVQEALTNVARHARVYSANVRLWCSENTIGIQIEDAGVGFNAEEVWNSHQTKGLLGLRERLGFLRGQLWIVTQPGEGACLTAEIPWEQKPVERGQDDHSGYSG